jgi:hypothetical protein
MSVLSTLWLKERTLVDRYGWEKEDVKVHIHCATTMGIYVHLSISYQIGELWIQNPEIEVQLNTTEARELGQALERWADKEDVRIAEDRKNCNKKGQ